MFNRLGEFILRSKIQKNNAARNRQFLSWDSIQNVALIVCKEQAQNKSAIDNYIERSKKHVEVFHVELDSKQPTYADWECFAKKDRSLLRLPRRKRISALHGKSFDLVINTCEDEELFTTALSASLSAPLKCGPGQRFGDTDLIIKRSEPFNLLRYLDDVTTYLKMIKP